MLPGPRRVRRPSTYNTYTSTKGRGTEPLKLIGFDSYPKTFQRLATLMVKRLELKRVRERLPGQLSPASSKLSAS